VMPPAGIVHRSVICLGLIPVDVLIIAGSAFHVSLRETFS
jgi:hypothetical protein